VPHGGPVTLSAASAGRAAGSEIGDDRTMAADAAPRSSESITVEAIATTPVKGCALQSPREVAVGQMGIGTDRAFFLVDDDNRMLNGKALGRLTQVVATVDQAISELSLIFPGGERVGGPVRLGSSVSVRFFRAEFEAAVVAGPWSDALSDYCGRPLRLCRAPATRPGVDRGRRGAVTLMSTESLAAITDAAGGSVVDGRRFRMTFTVAGAGPHGEDGWRGREVAIGDVIIRINDLVGRCSVTTRNPDTGDVDLPTLHILKQYRGDVPSDEGLPFGVFAEVVQPGIVRVGDPVAVLAD